MSSTEVLWKRWAEIDYIVQDSLNVVRSAVETGQAPEWLLDYVEAYGAGRRAEALLMREIAASGADGTLPLMRRGEQIEE